MTRKFRSTVRDEFWQLLRESEATRLEYKDREMPAAVGREWARKIDRAVELADALDDATLKARWQSMKRERDYMREIPPENMHLPAGPSKSRGEVAGYIELGGAVSMSAGLQDFLDAGMPRHDFKIFSTGSSSLVQAGGKAYLPLTKAERSIIETKAIPTIGVGVIEPSRLPDFPQVTADMDLRIRDVLPVGRTSSDAVTYLREESYTPGGDYQTPGAIKGESTVSYTQQTAPVLTLAVWMPVLNQTLADFGQLRMLIDNRLRYDVALKEESEIVYGAGGTAAFEGLLTVAGTHDIATADARVTTPTVLDSIRVGITEVRRAGYAPDVLLIDPLDLEEILLLKADTEGQYLGGAFPSSDAGAGFRVWGLRVVETQAMEADNAERNLIVMDSKRAAALHVREELGVTVGLADDDFIRNKRRLLAEERSAFTIFAPKAIAKLQTAVGTT